MLFADVVNLNKIVFCLVMKIVHHSRLKTIFTRSSLLKKKKKKNYSKNPNCVEFVGGILKILTMVGIAVILKYQSI